MSTPRYTFPRLIQFGQPTEPVWLSGVRNKLAADGLMLSSPLLLLLCQGLDFYYRSARSLQAQEGLLAISGKSTMLWANLSATLGFYLEDYRMRNLDHLREEINRNVMMRVSPPMIEMDGVLMLAAGLADEKESVMLIHPEKNEYFKVSYEELGKRGIETSRLPGSEGQTGVRWLMINSPSFAKPVFPPLHQAVRSALEVWAHRTLHMPDLPETFRLTGRQAYAVWAEDLRELATGKAGWQRQVEQVLAMSRADFGPAWGRDLWAAALREAQSLIGTSLEPVIASYERSADMWVEWTARLAAVEQDAPERLAEAADLFDDLASRELEAAGLLTLMLTGEELRETV
ncbi:hypothetical protein OS242_17740 [Tumebacillus sp. DT12]|uniref:DUF4872 domain-containing protein n=1 Tax=Tumebacillus lacus TaxID=2995335 RepID=A0ABT3XAL2_9BACL|nr:DUF4872 domain-containing protein [Tumebacillus lacus]MCX7571789.1 hypothetical protein [Tumebacillus lacus]